MHETNNQSALELRMNQTTKYMTIGLLGVLALCVLLFMYVGTVKQSESVAQQNQQVQSKLIIDSDVCKVYPDQELCTLAREIAANPKEAIIPKDGLNGKDGSNGRNGADGSNGVDGRGVASFTQADGNLIVTYTDGQTQDLGRVVGKDGTDGTNGADGATGATGEAGRGIVAANVIQGSLVVSYTDGTTQDAGLIVGPKGDKGDTGEAGAPGEPGTPGTPGLTPTRIDTDAAGYVTITYNNGSTATAGRVILPSVEIFACTSDGKNLTLKLTNGPAETIPMDCTPDNIPGLN